MLSSTNTLNDIKAELGVRDNYGYDEDSAYDNAIIQAIDNAKYEYMYPAITEDVYDTLAVKDKTDLTLSETYLYKSEIYFSIGLFLEAVGTKKMQARDAASVTTTQAGISMTHSGPPGASISADYYKVKAFRMMNQAGYILASGCNRYGIYTEWRYLVQ